MQQFVQVSIFNYWRRKNWCLVSEGLETEDWNVWESVELFWACNAIVRPATVHCFACCGTEFSCQTLSLFLVSIKKFIYLFYYFYNYYHLAKDNKRRFNLHTQNIPLLLFFYSGADGDDSRDQFIGPTVFFGDSPAHIIKAHKTVINCLFLLLRTV